eukprot:s1749_g4.t1
MNDDNGSIILAHPLPTEAPEPGSDPGFRYNESIAAPAAAAASPWHRACPPAAFACPWRCTCGHGHQGRRRNPASVWSPGRHAQPLAELRFPTKESCASMVPEKILAEAFHQVATCHFHAGVLESGSPLDSSHTGRTVMEEDSAASPSSLGGGAQSTANLVSSHLDEALYSALARQSSTPQGQVLLWFSAASVGSGDPGVALAAAAVVSEVTQRAKELLAAPR